MTPTASDYALVAIIVWVLSFSAALAGFISPYELFGIPLVVTIHLELEVARLVLQERSGR